MDALRLSATCILVHWRGATEPVNDEAESDIPASCLAEAQAYECNAAVAATRSGSLDGTSTRASGITDLAGNVRAANTAKVDHMTLLRRSAAPNHAGCTLDHAI